ncbi:MAG: AsmA-like C-terminal region-containing protein, partial [Vicinamibacteria bacterium]
MHGKISEGIFNAWPRRPPLEELEATLTYSRRVLDLAFTSGKYKDRPMPPLTLTIDRRQPVRRVTFRLHGAATDDFVAEIRGASRFRDRLLDPERPGLFGLVSLSGLRVASDGAAPIFSLDEIDLRFNDDAVVLDRGSGSYKEVPFSLTGFVQKGNPPRMDVAATFEGPSVGRLFATLFPDEKPAGDLGSDGAGHPGTRTPASLDGRLEILSGRYRNLSLGDLETGLHLSDGVLRFDDFQIRNGGGRVTGSGWYGTRGAGFFFETEVNGMDAPVFLESIGLENKKLEGNVQLRGEMHENEDGEGPFLRRCEGEFTFEVTDGTLRDVKSLRKILDRLDVSPMSASAQRNDVPFSRITGTLRL